MIEYVNIMRCDVHISHSMSRTKDVAFVLFGASSVRIVSLYRFRLSESMLECRLPEVDAPDHQNFLLQLGSLSSRVHQNYP